MPSGTLSSIASAPATAVATDAAHGTVVNALLDGAPRAKSDWVQCTCGKWVKSLEQHRRSGACGPKQWQQCQWCGRFVTKSPHALRQHHRSDLCWSAWKAATGSIGWSTGSKEDTPEASHDPVCLQEAPSSRMLPSPRVNPPPPPVSLRVNPPPPPESLRVSPPLPPESLQLNPPPPPKGFRQPIRLMEAPTPHKPRFTRSKAAPPPPPPKPPAAPSRKRRSKAGPNILNTHPRGLLVQLFHMFLLFLGLVGD